MFLQLNKTIGTTLENRGLTLHVLYLILYTFEKKFKFRNNENIKL